jgi:ornithine cyclodeaminase/alanine dehydrogenase-like protein (mu-crystallin family)
VDLLPKITLGTSILIFARLAMCNHAIAHGLMRKEDVYAELCEIIAGQKIGRVADDEIIVFDSTGVAIEDAIAAAAVYERALANGIGTRFNFAA